jgi:hypothetical protein
VELNKHGYLEPGFHDYTIDDMKKTFVEDFKGSLTRETILNGYNKYIDRLKQCITKCEQWVDGSFTTSKENPNDIDFLCIMEKDEIDSLPADVQEILLKELFDVPTSKALYKCDAYYLLKLPENHPFYYKSYVVNRTYWRGQFGFDRQDIAKGILKIDI